MNKLFRVLIAAIVVAVPTMGAYSQQMPPAPVDKNVRVGHLPNGLTYYIRHNEYPKGLVDFHIAQKVGAIQEEENQRGLAHFLEHMSFNGTQSFPGNTMTSWLESRGVKFGKDLNAYTGIDRTVYRITNVPAKENIVDSCLIILHDWADGLTLDPKEIDKERGVIHEEWRQENAFMRMIEKNGEKMYPNSKYGRRLPIGTMEVVDNFKPQVLRDYYEKWYRPDLQGIVIVGDIDVDKIESKIKDAFSKIKMPANPGKFEYYPVEDNDKPILLSFADKEMPAEIILLYIKYDKLPREMRNTQISYLNGALENIMSIMIGQRFDDISMKSNAPFAQVSISFGDFLLASNKAAVNVQIVINDKGYNTALTSVMTELKRIAEYGFTNSEFERAKQEFLSRCEKAYTNRDKEQSDKYAQDYIANFLDNKPMSSIEDEYNTYKMAIPSIPVAAINQQMKELFGGKNMVAIALGPDKKGVTLPSDEQMQGSINAGLTAKVDAPKEEAPLEPLMSEKPKAGKIISEKPYKLGYTELTLSNGVKVLLKATDYKADQIVFNAVSLGGEAAFPAKDHANMQGISNLWAMNGVDKFSFNTLQKVMSGKQANFSFTINNYRETMNGSSTPKDLETLMQLIYLNIVKPRDNKSEFETIRQMVETQLKNASLDPQFVFRDSMTNIMYAHLPKAQILNLDQVKKIDYDRMLEIVKEKFGNAADFTFIFTGNFNMDTMEQYLAEYIAAIPSAKSEPAKLDKSFEPAKGNVTKEFKLKSENNLAMLMMAWHANMPYTLENNILAKTVGQLFSTNLTNTVREELGAAYSPHGYGMLSNLAKTSAMVQCVFPMSPEKSDIAIKSTKECLERLAKTVDSKELDKVKEYMLKSQDENERNNEYWSSNISDYQINKVDLVNNYRDAVNNITPAKIQAFVGKLLKSHNCVSVVMMPEK